MGFLEFFPYDYKLSYEGHNYDDLIKKIKFIDSSDEGNKEGEKAKKYIKKYLNKTELFFKFEQVLNEFN